MDESVLSGWRIDCEPHAEFGIWVEGDECRIGPAILTPLRPRARVENNVVDSARMGHPGAAIAAGPAADRQEVQDLAHRLDHLQLDWAAVPADVFNELDEIRDALHRIARGGA